MTDSPLRETSLHTNYTESRVGSDWGENPMPLKHQRHTLYTQGVPGRPQGRSPAWLLETTIACGELHPAQLHAILSLQKEGLHFHGKSLELLKHLGLCVCPCTYYTGHSPSVEVLRLRGIFSPTSWEPGIKPRLSGLATSALTH